MGAVTQGGVFPADDEAGQSPAPLPTQGAGQLVRDLPTQGPGQLVRDVDDNADQVFDLGPDRIEDAALSFLGSTTPSFRLLAFTPHRLTALPP